MAAAADSDFGSNGMKLSEDPQSSGNVLDSLLAAAGLEPLTPEVRSKFDHYLALILRWNARMNLTAVRDPQEILSRHFLESIACARKLPEGIGSLLDFGSGAGFPGIPIALCRPEILVTLAESQSKKAAFLREAVRTLGLNSEVFGGRAEELTAQFDCATLRAVDRMELAYIFGFSPGPAWRLAGGDDDNAGIARCQGRSRWQFHLVGPESTSGIQSTSNCHFEQN